MITMLIDPGPTVNQLLFCEETEAQEELASWGYTLVTEHLHSTSQVLGSVPRWEGCWTALVPAWPFAYSRWKMTPGLVARPGQRRRWINPWRVLKGSISKGELAGGLA